MKAFLLLFLFLPLHAQDEILEETPVEKKKVVPSEEFSEKQQQWRISWKYRRGANLIYDCRKRHFACVNNENFEECKEARNESFRLNRSVLSCAPLKTFEDIGTCENQQKQLVENAPSKKFCVNHRKKIID